MEPTRFKSREELEYQYSPSRWSHRLGPDVVVQQHVKTTTQLSDKAKTMVDCELGFSYGLTEAEKFDIYGGKTLPGDAPIFVYIHGGYWQALGRGTSSFMVPTLTKAGAVVVVIGYTLAPNASMDEIVGQVRRAVSFVLTMSVRRGSSGVYLCGASAGSHLSTMMLAQDWLAECMVSHGKIKGALLVAGIYDLRPLVNTYINEPIKMSEEDAIRNSPYTWLDKISELSQNRKIIVAFGEHDAPEFRRQSTEFNNALLAKGIRSTMIVVPDVDHFTVIENLQYDEYILTKEAIKLMCLNIDSIVGPMEAAGIS